RRCLVLGGAAAPPETTPELRERGEPPARIIRPPADLNRPREFTIAMLSWTPWLEPLSAAEERPEHAAALEGDRGKSPYFRLLARDVRVLVERTATDRGIFYTPGGAPRHESELSAAENSAAHRC